MKIKLIVFLGLYIALFMGFTFIPYTGYITIGPYAITILPILIVVGTYHLKFWGAMVTSLAFGFGSFFLTLAGQAGVGTVIFMHPEVSIIARWLIGFTVYLFVRFSGEIKIWKFMIATAIASISNTIFVTIAIFIVKNYDHNILPGTSLWVWLTIIYINFFVELSVGVFLSIALFSFFQFFVNEQNRQKLSTY